MRTRMLLSLLAMLLSTGASALDIPPGGDALYHQLRASPAVAIARLGSVNPTTRTVDLTVDAVLRGTLPTQVRVSADEYVLSAPLREGSSRLVFLAFDEKQGLYVFPMSLYSLQPADLSQATALRDAIIRYERSGTDKQLLKANTLALLSSPVPYIQYSVTMDLFRFGQFGPNDIDTLGRVLTSGQVEPTARELMMVQLGALNATGQASYFGQVLGNAQEPVSARIAALDALSLLRARDVIQRQAESVGTSTSPKLKRRFVEALAQE